MTFLKKILLNIIIYQIIIILTNFKNTQNYNIIKSTENIKNSNTTYTSNINNSNNQNDLLNIKANNLKSINNKNQKRFY